MKKYTFLFAVAATLALAACGSGSATNESKDSTAAVADSALVTDTSAAPVGPDSAVSGGGVGNVEKPIK